MEHRAAEHRAVEHPRSSFLFRWDTQVPRFHLSGRIDVGFLFVRPRVSVGYGLPHRLWWGADLVPILSGGQWGVYAGIRYQGRRAGFRTGALYSSSFVSGYLVPQSNYDARDLSLRGQPRAKFFASDSELSVALPLGPVELFSETQPLLLVGPRSSEYVFAETMGAIVAPPFALRQQLGLLFGSAPQLGISWGPAVEAVYVPARSDPMILRVGLTLRMRLYQDVLLHTNLLPAVVSPDNLGRAASPWLTVNVRFLWATNWSRAPKTVE